MRNMNSKGNKREYGFRIYMITVLCIITMLMTAACGKKSDKTTSDMRYNNLTASDSDSQQDNDVQSSGEEAPAMEKTNAGTNLDAKDVSAGSKQEKEDLRNTSAISSKETNGGIQDKIIRNVNLTVETKKFDSLIKTIDEQIKSLDGYVEKSKIAGQSYDSNDSRSASIVARIPKASLDQFVNKVDTSANIVSRNENTENVTTNYIDIESRKKALEIEQERLFAILEKAEKLENIITLESRLSDIRYELQNYETQLRTYDNQVEYSTVRMDINEVERITPVKKVKKTVWNRISVGFSNSVYHVSEGFKNFFVWFVTNLPYMILWAILIFVIVIIVRKINRKYGSGRELAASGKEDKSSGQESSESGKKL